MTCRLSALVLSAGLGALGPLAQERPALEALVEQLADGDEAARKRAVFRIWLLGDEARPAVAAVERAVDDPVRDVRLYAAAVVTRFEPSEAPRLMPLLVEALESSRELWFQEMAAAALMSVGPPAAPAVPALTAALDVRPGPDAAEEEREAVLRLVGMSAIALGNVGPRAASAVPKLMECLSLPDGVAGDETTAEVREHAAEALGKIGPGATAALSELRRVAASDSSAKVRVRAAAAVERIEPHPR